MIMYGLKITHKFHVCIAWLRYEYHNNC